MSYLIKNCRIISTDLESNNAAVEIENGIIKQLVSENKNLPEVEECFDACGQMLMPGFIDIHTHGAMGADVVDGSVEGIRKIAESKLKEGVTSFLPTNALKSVSEYMKNQTFAKVPGVHLEGPYINMKCAGAQNPAYVRKPDFYEVMRLNDIAKVLIVSYAIETDDDFIFTKKISDAGIVASCAHSAATHADFCKARKNGLKHLTHFCNQMTPLHHREIGLVGSGLADKNIVIEMICDKIHLCPDMINFAFNTKSTDKIVLITDSMAA